MGALPRRARPLPDPDRPGFHELAHAVVRQCIAAGGVLQIDIQRKSLFTGRQALFLSFSCFAEFVSGVKSITAEAGRVALYSPRFSG